MKSYIYLILFSLLLVGCNDLNDPNNDEDRTAPQAPVNVIAYNGDNRVDLVWDKNNERDLDGYNVYYSTSYNGKYTLIGTTTNNYYVDEDAVNGQKYYYAVTAFDYNGNESELSTDVVYSVPRPEGMNQSIFDYNAFPSTSGYNFKTYSVVAYNSNNADFYFENYQGTFYLDVYTDTDIQDMGATQSIYDIDYAPENGWSTTKDVIAKVGHTYVIWTYDNHYAKIRVKNITNERIVFDWTYQTVAGEPLLKKGHRVGTTIDQKLVPDRKRFNSLK